MGFLLPFPCQGHGWWPDVHHHAGRTYTCLCICSFIFVTYTLFKSIGHARALSTEERWLNFELDEKLSNFRNELFWRRALFAAPKIFRNPPMQAIKIEPFLRL